MGRAVARAPELQDPCLQDPCLRDPCHQCLFTGSASSWASFVVTILFIAYLIWLRRKTVVAAAVEDKKLLSTADFSVRITGLRVGVPVDELTEQLHDELCAALNIPREMIAQARSSLPALPAHGVTARSTTR